MISKVFFREFTKYLNDNGVEIQYCHNGQKLDAADYEQLFMLTYQFALAQSIVSEQDIDLSKFARMNFNVINPTVTTEKKMEEINSIKNGLLPISVNSIMDCFNDSKIFEEI